MSGQCEQRRVETDCVALAFQHRALQIVVQSDPRNTAPRLEGSDMAAQEVLHAGVQIKAQGNCSPGFGVELTG